MINEYENNLRRIICSIIGEADGTNFGVTPERIEIWKEKREAESKKYKGVLLETRLIYYSDFYDLSKIIEKNWTSFKPIFLEKKRFEIFFNEIYKYRDTKAHGREILSFQLDIIKGIVGDLKNQILKYHSKNENPDDYFIKILKISDNLGNIWEHTDYFNSYIIKKVLKVGDIIEFIVEAFDPKNREIEYQVTTIHDNIITQKTNSLKVEIKSNMISKQAHFMIVTKTIEKDYENSDTVRISCTIIQ